MKKIGIFLNFGPTTKLTTEGLGRYIGSLIKGIQEAGITVVIACPKWLKENVEELARDLQITVTDENFLTTRYVPPIWKLYSWLANRKKKHNDKLHISELLKICLEKISKEERLLNVVVEVIFIVVLGLPWLFYLSIKHVMLKGKYLLKKGIKHTINNLGIDVVDVVHESFDQMISSSATRLVNIINKSSNVDIWYIPTLFWPQVNNIRNGKIVINAPDLVTEEFPYGFADVDGVTQTNNCRDTLNIDAHYIVYSKYIGDTLLHNKYGINSSKYSVIYHSNHDLINEIEILDSIKVNLNLDNGTNLTDSFAKTVLASIMTDSNITGGVQLANAEYIFYASQFRPNKNIMNLLIAYEHLIHRKFRHERLVLTGRKNNLPADVTMYIKENGLSDEIIFCSGVSTQQLAALYRCAKLVVNPTLYEGGFPFTFGEGMSVGTPSLMSDIPQVREITTGENVDEMLFDPYNTEVMADKIEWGLDHVQYLFQIELPLYQKLKQRTDESVAKEYMDVFMSL